MKIKIIYFSGTGNTKFVLEKVKDMLLEKMTSDIELISVANAIKKPEILNDDDFTLGLSFPVYDYKPPEIIMDFMKSLKKRENPLPAFVISTYTSDALDCNSHAIDILAGKNYYVINECSIKAPGASAFLYGNPENRLVRDHITFAGDFDSQIDKFTSSIISRFSKFYEKPFTLPTRFHKFNRPLQIISKLTFGNIFYRNLKVNKDCSGCGICVKVCPEENLKLVNGSLEISKKNGCHRCLGCVQACNKAAINFTSSKRRGFYTKETIVNCYSNRL